MSSTWDGAGAGRGRRLQGTLRVLAQVKPPMRRTSTIEIDPTRFGDIPDKVARLLAGS
jgi:hypothetical protein